MTQKEKDLEALKEATLVYYKAIEKFKKAQPYPGRHKGALLKATASTKLLAKSLHLSLTDKPRFQKVVITNPAPVPQPRQIEESEPEETAVLADNAETPEAKKQQRKKRAPRRKRGPNKKK